MCVCVWDGVSKGGGGERRERGYFEQSLKIELNEAREFGKREAQREGREGANTSPPLRLSASSVSLSLSLTLSLSLSLSLPLTPSLSAPVPAPPSSPGPTNRVVEPTLFSFPPLNIKFRCKFTRRD